MPGTLDHLARLTETGLIFGCDYNPEQWGRDVWDDDVRLMREVGINLVAINIFGWSSINPAHGVWDFEALDAILDLLHENGIRVNLGTGTASPPPWLTTRHPEMLPVADDGTTRFPGGRQAYCPSSPVFRTYAAELVTRVAERYGSHPAVALWHVSNELGCHNALCYCGDSAAAFRVWLEARYTTIDALNAAWGTTFWSQRYSDWADILPPLQALSGRNPGQMLDFHRFSSDEQLALYRAEAEILRERSTVPVTTNFMVTAHIRNMDYWSWTADMDLIANDHYLDRRLADPTAELSFAADVTRGLAGGKPWMLMETSTGAVNWQPVNRAKAKGELLRNVAAHVARGADGICFFQWRASLQGTEKFHSSLVPHAGTDSAAWQDVRDLGDAMRRLAPVAGSRVQGDIALVFSWENWWAAEGDGRPSEAVEYLSQVHAAHAAATSAGLTVDIVRPGADLTGYRVAIVPALYLTRDAEARAIADVAASGGSVLITFYSGIVDENDRVGAGGYPAVFRDLLGIRVEEFAPIDVDETVTLESGITGTLWTERLRTTDAEVLDTFATGPSAGMPALTRNAVGDGSAWYVATMPEPDAYRALVERVATAAGVDTHRFQQTGMEIVRRRGDLHDYLFMINHATTASAFPAHGRDILTDDLVDGVVEVPAGAVRIIEEAR